jgi:adenylate cyclase class 1
MPGTENKQFNLSKIQKNRRFFQNYNRLRAQFVKDLNREKASLVFEIIPALLSLNDPDLPGYVSKGDDICGIYDISATIDLRDVISAYFPEAHKKGIPIQKFLVKRPVIESLFTIGSVGTIAQTEKSDFDIWVCFEDSKSTSMQAYQLHSKTEMISEWCQTEFNTEVHFFLSDLEKIRNNDFGQAGGESSGSSQRKFLKEECYRTLLLIAGKIPFWWVVPSGITKEDYILFWNNLVEDDPYESNDYIDLGFLEDVSREEFLGSALWQLTKGIKDPFKAILKMAMMERYLSGEFQGLLLCDMLKERVLDGNKTIRDMDPYLLMVETILDFYNGQKRLEERDLIQKAFYIKADPKTTRARLKQGLQDYKTEIFKDLFNQWNWPLELPEELNQINNWSYSRQVSFAQDINQFFFSTYRRLSGILKKEEEQAINAKDLNLLGRQIFVLFANQENKLQLIPLLGNKQRILDKCIFKFSQDSSGNRRWSIYDGTRYAFDKKKRVSKIFSAERIVRTVIWLYLNGLYDFHQTLLEIPINPPGVSISNLNDLLKNIEGFFIPASQQEHSSSDFKRSAGYDKILAVMDMETKNNSENSSILDIIYSNTWGEIFTETYPLQEGLLKLKEYVLRITAKNAEELISKVKLYIPNSPDEVAEKRNTYKIILRGLTP